MESKYSCPNKLCYWQHNDECNEDGVQNDQWDVEKCERRKMYIYIFELEFTGEIPSTERG